MCELCRQNPCHPSCPNAPEDTALFCDACGSKIPPGSVYTVDFCGHAFCNNDCAFNWLECEEVVNSGE